MFLLANIEYLFVTQLENLVVALLISSRDYRCRRWPACRGPEDEDLLVCAAAAVLSGTTPAAGLSYDAGRKCPLMNLLLAEAKFKKGMVIDVGANGGCEMATALRHGRRVIGVECLESAYHELRMSSQLEHLNATVLHICASNSTRIAELNLASDSSSLIEDNIAAGEELKKVPKTGRTREPVVLVPSISCFHPLSTLQSSRLMCKEENTRCSKGCCKPSLVTAL